MGWDMLELKNIMKLYETKKGKIIALQDINLTFDEKGFVIILGKSGSGKSTLLNLIGGLDHFDNGEISINRLKYTNFNETDFDIYRNKHFGFVFQDFNIIDNLTIAENIALSLEVQGYIKEEIKEKVDQILNSVDLTKYKNRKPNEISGGQKQRVAIARALVKNPNIILADEPTGNLDNETGKSILNLLKNISKTKLVIMVTHDKEFAYDYGDRIIELADGIIVSDIINENKDDNNNIFEVGKINKTLPLTHDLISQINHYMQNSSTDVFLVLSGKQLKNTKKIHSDEFLINDSESNSFTLRKTSLSFIKILKLSYHYLFIKKLRLFFTSILFIFSLILVGLSLNLSFHNPIHIDALNIKKTNIRVIPFYKEGWKASLTNNEIENLKDDFSTIQIVKSIKLYNLLNINGFYFEEFIIYQEKDIYDLLAGEYPTELNEIMITESLANELLKSNYLNAKTYEGLIGKNFVYYNKNLIISGIVNEDSPSDDLYDNPQPLYMTQETFEKSINTLAILKANNNLYYQISNIDVTYEDYLIEGSHLPNSKDEVIITLSNYNNLNIGDNLYINEDYNFKIVGIIDDINNEIQVPFKLMLNNDKFNSIQKTNRDVMITGVAYLNNYSELNKLLVRFNQHNIRHNIVFSNIMYNFNDNLLKGKIIVYGVSFILTIFTILLLYTYISISITNKQKDIGILKSLGVTYKDISKIFIFEGLTIGIYSSIIAIILNILTINLINNYSSKELKYSINIIYNNTYSILLVILMSIIISYLITYITVRKYKHMKPIQIINL